MHDAALRQPDHQVTIKPVFFVNEAGFRKWLQTNHATADEVWVGFYKKHTGKPTVTYKEAVDQALCFGWIDGIRKSIDDESYMNRFTPRRKGSNWSSVNIKRAQELIADGLMKPAGAAAFAVRDESRTGRYSFERENVAFSLAQLKQFKKNREAWRFFEEQPPSYRKLVTHWVTSAKQPATQERRLAQLMKDSAAGQRIAAMRPGERKK
jgi:uncharacterized protein YdeI (YjbR/CyaY-like superfamily)